MIIEEINENTSNEFDTSLITQLLNHPDNLVSNEIIQITSHEVIEWDYRKVTVKFIQLAIPFSATRLFDICSEIVGGILFSHLGPEYLAANSLLISMQRLFTSTGTAFLFSMGVSLRQHNKNPKKIGEITRQGILLSILLSFPPIAIAACSDALLVRLGQDNEVASIINDFYVGAIPSLPCILISSALQQFTLSIEQPNISLIINILTNVMVLSLGSIFTLGLLGAPNLGVRGLGYAYSISYGLSAFGQALFFLLSPSYKNYQLGVINCIDLQSFINELKSLFLLGLPIGLQVSADYLMRFSLLIIAGCLGQDLLMVARITEMVYIFLFTTIIRAAQVTTNLSKDAYTEKNKPLIKQIAYVNISTMLSLTAVWTSIAYALKNPLLNLFFNSDDLNNHQIIYYSNWLFGLYPLGLTAEAVRYTLAGSLRGLKDTTTSMWNSVLILILLGIPAMYFGYEFKMGLPEIYGIANGTLALAAISLSFRWRKAIRSLFTNEASIENRQEDQIKSVSSSTFSRIRNWSPSFFSTKTLLPPVADPIEEIASNSNIAFNS